MTLTRANPSGWGVKTTLTSAQANTIDINVSRAIDGNGGGAYAPTSTIDISGSGARFFTYLTLKSGCQFATESGSTSVFGGSATFNGATKLAGATSVSGALTLSGTSLTVSSASMVALLNGSYMFPSTASLLVDCGVTFSSLGSVYFGGGLSTSKPFTMTSGARVRATTFKLDLLSIGSSTTWPATVAERLILIHSAVSSAKTVLVDLSSCDVGDAVHVIATVAPSTGGSVNVSAALGCNMLSTSIGGTMTSATGVKQWTFYVVSKTGDTPDVVAIMY